MMQAVHVSVARDLPCKLVVRASLRQSGAQHVMDSVPLYSPGQQLSIKVT